MEDQAKVHNTRVDRSKWRLVGLCHTAETIEQAYRDVEYGIEHWFQYFQAVAAFPQMAVPGNNVKEMISFINDSGFGAIGTPDMVTAQIDRLITQSNGGFGAYLMLAHNWADPRATQRLRIDRPPRDAAFPRPRATNPGRRRACARRALRPRRATAESGRSRDGSLRQGQGESSGLRRNRRQSSDRKSGKGGAVRNLVCEAILTPMEAHMAIKLDGLLAGVTRRLFSPRTAYSTSSRKLWRNDPEGPRP